MPWTTRKKGSQWCVYKKGESSPVPGGCHATKEEARRHQRALYAGEGDASATGSTLFKMNGNSPVWYFVGPNATTAEGWFSIAPAISATSAISSFSTITIDLDEQEDVEEEAAVEERVQWEGVLALEGAETADKRYLMPGEISDRDLPMPIMVQVVNEEGHKGSELGGRIDNVTRIPIADFNKEGFDLSDLPETTIVVWGEGSFDSSEAGQNGSRLIDNGGGVSVDMSVTEVLLLDPETYEPVDPDELDLMEILFGGGDFVTGMKGTIMGATVLPFPAFEEATINVVTASGGIAHIFTNLGLSTIRIVREVLTASAAGLAPLAPPREWFEMPEPDLPTPLTVTKDGRVFGHLAVWGQCHTGFQDICQMAPKSRSNYDYFHLGEIETAEGDCLPIGKITVGTGHAPISYGPVKTIEHYDNTGTVAAFVRARDGRRGIWISGAVRSDLPSEKIRDLRANPPSGDWRLENGALELHAILAVVDPGFPVVRSEARLVASGGEQEMEALVAMGYAPDWPKKRRRKKKMLSARLKAALDPGVAS